MSDPAANEAVFVEVFWADVDAGRVHSLAHYLDRFPGCEGAVREEYAAGTAAAARAATDDSPPDPGLAPELPPGQSRSPTNGWESGGSNRVATGATLDAGAATTSDRRPALSDLGGSPSRLGDFELLRELGRGGMGVVYLAAQSSLGRKVALKVIKSEWLPVPGVRERFQREAVAASRLNHPGICQVFEVGEVDGIAYMAMRFVEGESLAQRIARETTEQGDTLAFGATTSGARRKGVRDACRIIEKVARALHAAHEARLIHRDLKPGNIMVEEEDEPVILDFGLARICATRWPMNYGVSRLFPGKEASAPGWCTRLALWDM